MMTSEATSPLLVIVDDLDIFRACVGPEEADAPLPVDADPVLAFPVTGEFFQSVARRDHKVGKSRRRRAW